MTARRSPPRPTPLAANPRQTAHDIGPDAGFAALLEHLGRLLAKDYVRLLREANSAATPTIVPLEPKR